MVGLIRTFIFTNIIFICLTNSCFSQDKIKYYSEIRDGFIKGAIEMVKGSAVSMGMEVVN